MAEADDLVQALRAAVPAAMRALPQWLLWRFESYEGDKKPRKVPYWVSGRKRSGVQGGKDDRGELVGFDIALTHLERGRYDGLGFAFLPGDGLIGIDIDGAIDADTGEVSARCQAIIDACASYTEYSPSGRGVHIIVAGETGTTKDNSIGLEVFCGRQFFTVTGRRWPGSPAEVAPIAEKTLARLRKTVEQARTRKPTAATIAATTAVQAGGEVDPQRKLESALDRLSPDMGHDDWVMVGMALKHALGEAGFRLWDYWSGKGAKYPGSDALGRKWASFHGASAHGTVTEASIFKMATQAGWKPPRPPRKARSSARSSAAAPAADGASTPTPASGGGGEGPPEDDPPVADDEHAGAAPEHWRKRLLGDGGKKDCRENVYTYLVNHPKLKGLVAYNEFSHQVLKMRAPPWDSTPGEWTTNDDYFLALWLAQHERITFKSESTLVAGVAMAAFAARYHPVKQYLEELPPWDGVERLRHWLHECLGAEESEYTALVGSWFVMGMVRRVRDPGCQNDYMIVLEGLQGKKKSTALRTLAARDEWFSDTPMRVGTPDALLTLAGKWVVEIPEMDSFNRAEATAVKAYITSRVDRVREPYARRFVDRPRSGVLVGSTNQAEYFKDPTGARRFWPVACDGEIELDKLREWRDQLFAEALMRLASADPQECRCWPTRAEEEKWLVPQQEKREIVDPWFDRLALWLDSSENYGDTGEEIREVARFTAFELLTRCLSVPMDRIDGNRQMSTRVGQIMHKLGWVRDREARPPRIWFYQRPKRGEAPGPGPAQQASGGPTPSWSAADFEVAEDA